MVPLTGFNQTASPYPSDRTVVDLFQEQAGRAPDAEAIRCGGRALSYRELNERANQMACQLMSLGVRPEQPVLVKMEHSIEVVCAILGILKAGAAFVPIDPSSPILRVETLLRQIQAFLGGATPVLLAGPGQVQGLPEGAARVVTLRPGLAGLELFRRTDPEPLARPGGLAYVIYTSGSTGEPKGVMIEHRSLVNYIWWARRSYVPGEGLAWALFSSLAFDLTITTLFTPLISGGRIVVYHDDAWAHGTVLFKVIEDRAVNIMKLTPAHLGMLQDLDLGGLDLRVLIVGGEDFKADLARAVTRQIGRPVAIFNEYGPTEATVGCMIHRFDPDRDQALSVPIGVPAANMNVFVLDDQWRPVPPGVDGQMYLAGDGLARGYLNRPDLTQQRFLTIPHPDGGDGPVRVYQTGDLARWGDDGRLVFLGRSDQQVKIGGARIELGEIEARLQCHPEVRTSVVTVVQVPGPDAAPVQRLAAYYVSDRPLAVPDLRRHLAEALPEYMVPSYYLRIPELPLTTNGKVDRAALPAPDSSRPEVSAAYVEYQNPTQERVAEIWKEALKLSRVGVEDDFFELGGKSLPAIRILMQVRRSFGTEIPVADFFAHPTIARLAELIDRRAARK